MPRSVGHFLFLLLAFREQGGFTLDLKRRERKEQREEWSPGKVAIYLSQGTEGALSSGLFRQALPASAQIEFVAAAEREMSRLVEPVFVSSLRRVPE